MKIKLKFTDTYSQFKPEEFLIYKILAECYDVELSDDPDFVIAMSYGHEHLKYDAIKIFWTGENDVPDFNFFDYAIGFDHLTFGDRYLRVPLYPMREEFQKFRAQACPSREQLLNRKFCSFVVSNGGANPIRSYFFNELSKYKRVDSGGRYLNNIGGPVADKGAFLSQYKFNIAFENSAYPGYVTEKIMDAYSRWTMPIYWGDPLVETDFMPNTMVRVRDRDDVQRAIKEIIRLDNDDDEYVSRSSAECLVHVDRCYYHDLLKDFLCHIFDQDKVCARRCSAWGFQRTMRKERRNVYALYDRFAFLRRVVNGLKRRIGS